MVKIGTFLVMFLLKCSYAMESVIEDRSREIRAIVNEPASQFNGVLLVQQQDKVLFSLKHGITDKATKTPISLQNKFMCGSITKQMIAALILKSEIDLHSPLYNYGIAVAYDWSKEVTCHHLLSHTAGILHPNKEPSFKPGEGYVYSNYGYHLLGELLEEIKGQKLEDIFKDFFADIGLQESCFYPGNHSSPVGHIDNLVPGYMRLYGTNYWLPKQDPYKASWPAPYLYPAAGGVVTTASDLHQWNMALHNGNIISDDALTAMTTAYTTINDHYFPESVGYGYGLQIVDGQGPLELSHAGYVWGYMGMNCFYPKEQVSLILMQNVAEPLLPNTMNARKYAFRTFIKIRHQVWQMIRAGDL